MLAFYEGVLGLTVDRDRPELGLTHIRAGRQMIDLVTLDGPLGKTGGAARRGLRAATSTTSPCRSGPFDDAAIRAHLAAPRRGGRGGRPALQRPTATGFSLYVRDPAGQLRWS